MAQRQRGNILFMTLMFLLLCTVLVALGIRLGQSHLRIVGNDQAHGEALNAAKTVVDQVLHRPATSTDDPIANPGAFPKTYTVDIDSDGSTDFSVVVARPTCVGFREIDESSISYQTYGVQWDIQATVTDTRTGAEVVTHQGVRVITKDSDPCS